MIFQDIDFANNTCDKPACQYFKGKAIKLFFILTILLASPFFLDGQDLYVIEEDDLKVKVDTFWQMKMAEDPLSIDEAVKSDEFVLVADSLMRQEILTTNWIRFRMENPSSLRRNFYLSFLVLDHYTIRAYSLDEQGQISGLDTLGAQEHFAGRAIPTRLPIIPVGLNPGEQKTIFIYLDRRYLPYKGQLIIVPEKNALTLFGEVSFWSGLFMGVMFLHLIIALIAALFFKKRAMFSYVVYVLGLSLFVLYSRSLGEIFFLKLGKNGSPLFDCLPYCSTLLLVIGHTGVFRNFFQLKKKHPKTDSILYYIQVASFLLILLLLLWKKIVAFWPIGYQVLVYFEVILALASSLIIICTALFYFKGTMRKESILFMLVFFPILSLSLLLWGMDQGMIPYWEFGEHFGPGIVLLIEGGTLGSFMIRRFHKEQKAVGEKMRNERRLVVDDLHSGLSPEITRLRKIHTMFLKPLENKAYAKAEAIDYDLEASIRSLMWIVDAGNEATFAELAAKLRDLVRDRFDLEDVNATVATYPELLPDDIGLPFITNYHVYHIVKQIVNNCAEHANANTFSVEICFIEDYISFDFSDDGIGFDPGVGQANKKTGRGHGMAELNRRSEKINAVLEINPIVGKGTFISLKVPLVEEMDYSSNLFTP